VRRILITTSCFAAFAVPLHVGVVQADAGPAPLAGEPTTALILDGEPGDYITAGQRYTFSDVNVGMQGPNAIGFSAMDAAKEIAFGGSISAAPGDQLAVGAYENVGRFPFFNPGLSVGGEGRGCNTVSGRFVVDEVEYGEYDADIHGEPIVRLAARFEQHCEGARTALFGQILYNSTQPLSDRVLSAESVDFGGAGPGVRVERDLVLTNQGSDDFHVASLSMVAPISAFAVDTYQCSIIPAGGSCAVRVVFTGPTTPGPTANTLVIHDDLAPTGGQGRSVQVRGEGLDPRGEFTPLTPNRILDTRNGTGAAARPLMPASSIDVQVTGVGGVPAIGVDSVVFNLTATEPTVDTYVTAWPAGMPRPEISNVNVKVGETRPNLVTVAVGTSGRVSLFNNAGSTHLIADVVGFYATAKGPAGLRFHAIQPGRLFDTRDGTGGVGVGPLGSGEILDLDLFDDDNTTGVGAIVLNVTVTEPTSAGYVTVAPGDVAPPLASNLNFVPGQTIPNLVIVRVPESGVISFLNSAGSSHLLADIVGYYDLERERDRGRFTGITPQRILDTRPFGGALLDNEYGVLGVANSAAVPGTAKSVVLNVTATATTHPGYLTVFPGDACLLPATSNLNFVAGDSVPNLVMVALSDGGEDGGCDTLTGRVAVYNSQGSTDVILDVFGYFT